MRVVLLVLDSLGIGALPDAAFFGDEGSHTLRSCYQSGALSVDHLISLGLGNVEGNDFLPRAEAPLAAYGRMAEKSRGKDTTIGHWELAGIVSEKPFPTYPDGFPPEVLSPFCRRVGRGVLCNRPASGTEVIRRFGEEHCRTGDLIVYTSGDSVFQIAAHEEKISVEELYEICRCAREILQGQHAVGRVIARPFRTGPEGFERTANRHDFSLPPPAATLLDHLKERGKEVIGVGKIEDIFAGRGLTESHRTYSNRHGMSCAKAILKRAFDGLLFVNLVDFDSQYGHRNDAAGYARALSSFDRDLGDLLSLLKPGDLLLITADHGCDPGSASTDHSREYVPILAYGEGIAPVSLGTAESFASVAATVSEFLLGENLFPFPSLLSRIRAGEKELLMNSAENKPGEEDSPREGEILVFSRYEGYLAAVDPSAEKAVPLAGGRIRWLKQVGDRVKFQEPVAALSGVPEELLPSVEEALLASLRYSPRKVKKESSGIG